MSGTYWASEETVTLDLEPGVWVELKKELDYGEENELEGAAIRAGLNPDGTARMEFSLRDQRLLMLALYLVDWAIPGPNGKPVQLPHSLARKKEVVSHLRPKWARRIVARIEQLRVEAGALDAISVKDLDGAAENPTVPGDGSASGTPSSSPDGSAASATPTSSALLTAS